jgi:asparagine synthase (glutamine-hydrolysing)
MEDGAVRLGHCRLSIIDVNARSDQPMTSISGETSIVFNGEIYNYRELRDEMREEGVRFKTQGDTEVLLEGYERYGTKFFERLRGMWAFVIYDRREGVLIASRDPFGIKPLIYAVYQDSIFFSSEIRGFRDIVPLNPDPNAYAAYYSLGYFLPPSTPYKNVWKVMPGDVLRWDIARKQIEPVDAVSRFGRAPSNAAGEPPYTTLDEALTDSVDAHYVADVPVSLLLSGGTDSSLIAALSHKLGKSPISFHVAVEGSEDTAYARAVARHLGLELIIEELTAQTLERQYERIFEILDEPTADVSVIPTSLIYERIKGRAKVVLSGEGGDEFFGGYMRHRMLMRHSVIAPHSILNTGWNGLLSPLPSAVRLWNPFIQRTRALFLSHGIPNDLLGAYLRGVRIIDYPLSDPEVRGKLAELYERERDERILPPLAFDLLAYLSGDLMYKGDITSMAASIESRVPLLDRFLSGPASAAVRARPSSIDDKGVLKDVLATYLPHELVFRPKKGFGVPIQQYRLSRFRSDFDAACRFHLQNRDSFGVSDQMSRLIRTAGARDRLSAKFPRFAFALISNWKLHA